MARTCETCGAVYDGPYMHHPAGDCRHELARRLGRVERELAEVRAGSEESLAWASRRIEGLLERVRRAEGEAEEAERIIASIISAASRVVAAVEAEGVTAGGES